ncbi:hypothetical protein B7494_g3726 [Chlorociboria aeruginascens]|nr:hypothetical protein B7494_g3726 [Chlorociboria aeruginascens]
MVESKELLTRTPTYHNDTDAAYLLPNDPIEQTRLEDQHNALVALLQHVFCAPVTSPTTVLDIGCGTGIVTRYLSSYFPAAKHVYGIDLSIVPAQPSDLSLPNLSFIHGNFRKLVGQDPRLSYGSVDFVFSRMLLSGMTDWSGYVKEIFNVLQPDGWAEMGDYVEDVFYTDKRIVPREEWEWLRCIREGGALQGLDLDAGVHISKYMEDAGFVDVQRWEFAIPYWRTPGADSEAMTEHVVADKWGLYWHMIPRLVERLNLSVDTIERFRRDMGRDLREERGKVQLFYVTIGRKPEAS